jgi:hypothetical protein
VTEQELADIKTRLRDIAEPRLRHLLVAAEELEESSDPSVRLEAARQIRMVVEWLAGRVA